MFNEVFSYNNVFEKSLGQFPGVVEPVVKFNKLAVAQLEKWADLQLDVYGTYTELALSQIHGAAEVSDVDSLNAFLKKQAEVFNTVRDKQIEYAQALTKLGTDFSTELEKLTKETVVKAEKQTQEKVAAADKPIVKKV